MVRKWKTYHPFSCTIKLFHNWFFSKHYINNELFVRLLMVFDDILGYIEKQNIRFDLQINIQNPQFLRMKTFFNVNLHMRCAIRTNPLIIFILIVTHIIIFMSKHKRNIMLLNFPLKHQLLSN